MTMPLVASRLPVVLTVLIQGFGSVWRLRVLFRHSFDSDGELPPHKALPGVILTALGLLLLHCVQILVWAVAYRPLTSVQPIDSLEGAVNFSAATFTTFGGGDIALSTEQWQLLTGIDAPNGLVLLGCATALLFAVSHRSGSSHALCKSEDGTYRRAQWPSLLEPRDVLITDPGSVP